jgi:signal transduction histidine kinase
VAQIATGLVRARPRPSLVDTALALLFAVAAQVEVWLAGVPGPPEAKAVAAVLTTLPLAWRTIAPVWTTAVTMGGLALAILLGLPPDGSLVPTVAPLLAVYSVGAHAGLRGMATAAAASLIPLSLAVAAAGEPASEIGLYSAAILAALVVGRAVTLMGFEADLLEARASELERERDQRARAAVAAERARIARELHDIIGHSISVMGVQAGGVRRLLAPEQQREREALLAVERTGRDAVAEMRRLLGFLRSDDGNGELGALPTLRRVDDLIADMRRAGLDVELHVEGEFDDLSPGRALVAFRILQEALTNALKHAPAAHVWATLRRTEAEVRIEVVDDGGGARAAPREGGGHGLVGMRERVALYGGSLEAGPLPGRGFKVVARFPAAGA